jgi:hypothetical protein
MYFSLDNTFLKLKLNVHIASAQGKKQKQTNKQTNKQT